MPAGWIAPTSQPTTQQSVVTETSPTELEQWWTTLNDPLLNELIRRAIESNLDLKLAESRVLAARESRVIVSSGLYPNVGSSASYRRSVTADRGRDLFQAGLDAAWELDIFGGTRRSVEASEANLQSAIENQRDVLVTLTSEVALNYIDLRGFQNEIRIARQNLEIQRQSAAITRRRFAGGQGFVGGLDVANSDAAVASIEAQIPSLEASVRQSIYSLSVLLGQPPAALLPVLSEPAAIPRTPRQIPVGLPSDLLRRRPDIRRAEADLHSATAQIGVATAALYPSFNLAGSIGVSANSVSSLFNWNNSLWSIGPGVSWPIFEAGRLQANVRLQTELQRQSFLSYQRTLLVALQDVENALINYEKDQQRRESLVAAVDASRRSLNISTSLYTEGQTLYLDVLTAQRSLISSEDALVQSDRNIAADLVSLYKALGGGWPLPPEEQTPTTQP
jgi:NodT family efflux transporter outer membrane factor (OMF) lipoprotein